ncbi:hypothetical protein S1OALGB6SA_1946 [Olavius algarvensis spirochete endosymbiont]|nr:hypothetical protein S1OALGB6SA_1946 [Olavius algarvensis spirochete endosymbiont]
MVNGFGGKDSNKFRQSTLLLLERGVSGVNLESNFDLRFRYPAFSSS